MSEKTHYVYSTLTDTVNYQVTTKGGGDLPTAVQDIVIQGGANIPDKFLRTPEGAVITPVTEQELIALEANEVFKLHKANGFIKVSDKKQDGAKAAADMTGRDDAAPLVDADFKQGEAPVTAKADDDDEPRPMPPKTSGRRA